MQRIVPNESLNAEMIRQQVLYGREHNIDDGVTNVILCSGEKCVYAENMNLHHRFPIDTSNT